MSIVRWDPFRDMVSLRDAMDRLLEESFVRSSAPSQAPMGLALDITEDENEIVVKGSVPGVKPEDLDISVLGNVLTIKGQFKQEEEQEKKNYLLHERRYGSFSRTVTLPVEVVADKATADFKDGVLTLTLPKVEEVKPKQIKITPTSN
ncbi:MAG: Hsp20/alpha crystallin family protein [Chloroflexi bacterium]|nr:Hsp20/alpha crystallin family protein [Chloroflexota bacterium]